MATSDGGASWTRQYAGEADLDQVDFIDGEHGWAAGGDTLLRTANGGASWTALAEPCPGDLDSVHFVSPALGYAVAAAPGDQAGGPYTTAVGGSLLRTSDGGGSWTALAEPCQGELSSVHFVSSTLGYAVAAAPGDQAGADGQASGAYTAAVGGSLLRTTDAGSTWTAVTGTPANPQSACFANADDGYLGTPAHIWRTTDGGQHWTLALTEPGASGNPTTADTPEIECAGASGLWVLFLGQGAATGHAPYLAYASQDGHEWHGVLEEQFTESALRPSVKLPDGPGSYPGPISAIDPGTAVFVGYTPPLGYGVAPVMLASNNGYALTKEGDVGTINEPIAAAFLSPDQGWVVGRNLHTNAFSVEATSDAGHTWTTQYTTG